MNIKRPIYKLSLLCFILCLKSVWAASFIYTPFDKQLRDADAAIFGVIKGSTVKKDPDGQVMTRYTLELSWAAGLDRNQDVHPESFHVNVPGGAWQGIEYQVSGAPSFESGEKVFLLLNDSKFGHVVLNLSLGKYTFYKEGAQSLLRSSVFPEHPELGSIKLEEVKTMAQKKFNVITDFDHKKEKESLARLSSASHSPKEVKSGRSPATVEQTQKQRESSSSLFWPFVILVLIATSRKVLRFRTK